MEGEKERAQREEKRNQDIVTFFGLVLFTLLVSNSVCVGLTWNQQCLDPFISPLLIVLSISLFLLIGALAVIKCEKASPRVVAFSRAVFWSGISIYSTSILFGSVGLILLALNSPVENCHPLLFDIWIVNSFVATTLLLFSPFLFRVLRVVFEL